MTRLHTAPEPQEFEDYLWNDLFDRRGLKTNSSRLLGFSRQNLDAEIKNERGNFYFTFMRRLWAVDLADEEAGDLWIAHLLARRRKWKQTANQSSGKHEDSARLASKASTEVHEITIAELERKPMQERLQKAIEARVALDNYIDGLRFDDIENAEEELAASAR